MPREVKAYACKFRCGERVNTHIDSIYRHERVCFKNPKLRACPACRHNKRFFNEFGPHCFVCEIDKKPDENKTFITKCKFFESPAEEQDD